MVLKVKSISQDLSEKECFSLWEDNEFFKNVQIGSIGEIYWNENIDLFPDEIYMEITGKTPEEFPNLKQEIINA
jgi:hypothetical protein